MAFEELKQRQSVMWGNGPFENVADTIADIHEVILERIPPRAGERWLDVACGTGAVAERAARAGAVVTGVDLAPVLIDTAKRRAAGDGLEIDYRVGDCERLDGIDDAAFDVVVSTCGVMFSPDHEASARQLARVTKPGGRLGLANWEPDGGLGAMFRMMAPFQAAPPPSSPFDWGREDRVRELLGDRLAIKGGERVLDVATGPGGVAIRAARRGADVTGVDIAPRLLEVARTAAAGAPIRFDVGDAQDLPYTDATFDVVTSCFG